MYLLYRKTRHSGLQFYRQNAYGNTLYKKEALRFVSKAQAEEIGKPLNDGLHPDWIAEDEHDVFSDMGEDGFIADVSVGHTYAMKGGGDKSTSEKMKIRMYTAEQVVTDARKRLKKKRGKSLQSIDWVTINISISYNNK